MVNTPHSNQDDTDQRRQLITIIQKQTNEGDSVSKADVVAAARAKDIDPLLAEETLTALCRRGAIERDSDDKFGLTHQ